VRCIRQGYGANSAPDDGDDNADVPDGDVEGRLAALLSDSESLKLSEFFGEGVSLAEWVRRV
jgi:hypothetical protein